MLTTIEDASFIREIEAAILEHCEEVHELTYVEHGEDNIVALVNREFVFRFPRNERSARRLVLETALLQRIKGKIKSVAIPDLIQVHTRPLYVVARYIPGDHLTGKEVQALSEEDQVRIGSTLGVFMSEFTQSISGLEMRRLRVEASVEGLDQPWPQYFERLFEKQPLPNSKLRPIIDEYYGTWKNQVASEQNSVAIHDDLHPANLLFETTKLSGVVDFGDANVGSIESEMRCLYLMGETVLKAAVAKYEELTGNQVAYDHIRIWAVMHALSTFTDRLARQKTDTLPFLRARENLRNWVPDFPL